MVPRAQSWLVYVSVLVLPVLHVHCKSQKLFLILIDGARWDYLDKSEVLGQDGFKRMMREGVRAEYLEPAYPSVSYPNYYSIMTGLYTESHGMTGNYMYDVERETYFLIGTTPVHKEPYWWDEAEPLWVTATRQNKTSYFYYWPGCEVTIRGIKPTYCDEYMRMPVMKDTQDFIERAVNNLENDDADVVGVYVELVDHNGHAHLDNMTVINGVLQGVDKQLAYLQNTLAARGLADEVNIMVFSDHGMTLLSEERVVNLTNELTNNDVLFYFVSGPFAQVWPRDGRLNEVYRSLLNISPHLQVYKKEDIPERLHLKNGRLTPPIWIKAEFGWTILSPKNELVVGDHGYDTSHPDMRGIFLGTGPAFRNGYVTRALSGIDLYQVMCKIIDIPAQPNNGTWSYVKSMMSADFLAPELTSGASAKTSWNVFLALFTVFHQYIRHRTV